MFEWAGAQALDGFLKHFGDSVKSLTPQQAEAFFAECPVIKQLLDARTTGGQIMADMFAGYNKMSPDEKAEFWKNLEIAGAKLAAMAA